VILFVFAQVKMVQYLSSEVFKKVNEVVTDNLRNMMIETVNEVVANLDEDSEGKALLSRDEHKALALFAKTPLGGVARKLGIDPKLSVTLVNAEPDAISKLSEMFGTRVEIISAVIAVVRQDLSSLVNISGQIAEYPGVQADIQMAQMLVS
jgi:hypothetical protein